MSRKREQQRENKKELARQLGISGKSVPDKLLENERVTQPELKGVVLVVLDVKRGFFQKAPPASLLVGVWVKDPSGMRAVGHAVYGTVLNVGACALDAVAVSFADEVRYRRPGSFFVAAAVCEGDVDAAAFAAAVSADAAVAGYVDRAGAAAAVVEVAAVDRVRSTLALPLMSKDGRLKASLSVDVRL